jgi:hypothetical protein
MSPAHTAQFLRPSEPVHGDVRDLLRLVTAEEPTDSFEVRQQLAFLLLSVEADLDNAMAPFLDWCMEHREAIRAMVMTEPTSTRDGG